MQKKLDVHAVAELARLDFSQNEILRLEDEMLQFMEYAQCLSELSPHSLSADSVADTQSDLFRDDLPTSNPAPSKATQNAKQTVDGYIAVPITVGKESQE